MASGKENIERAAPNPGETGDVTQDYTAGATHVADVGRANQSYNRLIATAGNTLPTDIATETWSAEQSFYSARFKVTGGTAGHRARLVFDATPVDDASNTTQAANWLAAAVANAGTDVEYFEVAQGDEVAGVAEWSEWYQFSSPLRRVDAISVDADVALTIFIEVA